MTDAEDVSNVRPIQESHLCASCKLEVTHERRFDPRAHGPSCLQPEVRVRRLELKVEALLLELNNVSESTANSLKMLQIVCDQTVQGLADTARTLGKVAEKVMQLWNQQRL